MNSGRVKGIEDRGIEDRGSRIGDKGIWRERRE